MKNRKYRKNAKFVLVSLFKVMSRFSFFSFGRKGHFILKGFVGGGVAISQNLNVDIKI